MTRPVRVRIRPPIPSLVSIIVVTLLAMFGVAFLIGVAGINLITLLLLPLLGGLIVFGYRAGSISATATGEGITIRNLFGTSELAWEEVAAMSVEPSPSGRGSSVSVTRGDGSAATIEATWSPWYALRGPLEQRNRARCIELVESLESLRPHP